jgi:hypothetical protein
MEQQKIVLYTMFVEFFGKQTKLLKSCRIHLGFGIFGNQMGQQKTCLIYLSFFGGWEKSTNFEAWVQVLNLKQRDRE